MSLLHEVYCETHPTERCIVRKEIDKRTFEFAVDQEFRAELFRECRFVLKSGRPKFFNCVFVDCLFEPAFSADPWAGLLHNCISTKSTRPDRSAAAPGKSSRSIF
jgi:hypothetical protein